MSNAEKVQKLCGDYPENYKIVDISNKENFIFENDPNYQSVNLYDYDKNVVTVNSFQECEHYVLGGWDYIPDEKISEPTFHIYMSFISVIGIAILFIIFNKIFRDKVL